MPLAMQLWIHISCLASSHESVFESLLAQVRQQPDPAQQIVLMKRAASLASGDEREFALLMSNLGSMLLARGDHAGSLQAYERGFQVDPVAHQPLAWLTIADNLASTYVKKGEMAQAERVYNRTIEETTRPSASEEYESRASVYLLFRALALPPPSALPSAGAADAAFARRDERLQQLLRLSEEGSYHKVNPEHVSSFATFTAAYYGGSVRKGVSTLAKLIGFGQPPPPLTKPSGPRGSSEALRVGIITDVLQFHPLGRALQALLSQLRAVDGLSTVVILPFSTFQKMSQEAMRDSVTNEITEFADKLLPLRSKLPENFQLIRNERLDVLLFMYGGAMSSALFPYGFLRLAPIQQCTWGHPTTSALPEIDFFVSWDDAEPSADSVAQYTEQLVRMRHPVPFGYLPAVDAPAATPAADASEGVNASRALGLRSAATVRSDVLGVSEEMEVFGCLQAVHKLHPLFDAVLVGVLRQRRTAQLLLLEPTADYIPRATLLERFRRVARARGDTETEAAQLVARVQWIPNQPFTDFVEIGSACDAVLDTFPFSGFATTMDLMLAGAPVIALEPPTTAAAYELSDGPTPPPAAGATVANTRRAPHMRAATTAATLRTMGLEQLVAASVDDYVEIATRLVTDRPWAANLRARLGAPT